MSIMAFDFKKEYKEFYLPKNKPEIVEIPPMNFIAIKGKGNPNVEGGEYQRAMNVIYPLAYTLKMSYKTEYKIKGFFEYVVPPLEGLWWNEGKEFDIKDKDSFVWISMIRIPDFITEKDFEWAKDEVKRKKGLDASIAEFMTLEEGLCVQCMHIGPFDDEDRTVAIMDSFLADNGYENDINDARRHHEIYMSDMRKVDPSKMKTVIRHPIKQK